MSYIEDIADLTICSEKEYARFGSSLAVIDINLDGVLDIVVGEPYAGADTLSYDGGVQVLFGILQDDDNYNLEDGFKIKCEESPCGLGSAITWLEEFAEEKGPFLLIGGQFAGIGGRQKGGMVKIKQQSDWEAGREYLVPGDIEWSIVGDQDFQQISSVTEGAGFVAVGSPTFRLAAMEDGNYNEDDLQTTGHVKIIMKSKVHEIIGTAEFGALGSSLAVVNITLDGERKTLLAAGESSADSAPGGYLQTGRVHLYQVDTMAGVVEEVATLSGNSELGRFGMRLLPGWDGGLLVGAPYTGLGLDNYGKVKQLIFVTNFPHGFQGLLFLWSARHAWR